MQNVKDLFDTWGKIVAAVAGLAFVVYIIGGLAIYARLQRQGLPSEAVVPEIPRERLALLGLTQLLVTIVLGLLLVWIAGRMPSRNLDESWREWWARVRRDVWFLVPTTLGALALLVLTPVSGNGIASAVLLVTALVVFLVWGRRVAFVVVVLVAVGVAVVFTVLRQLEWPTPHNGGAVILAKGVTAPQDEDGDGDIEGRIVAVTDDEVLVGWESREQVELEDTTGEQMDLTLLRLPRSSVAEIVYDHPKDPVSFSQSLPETLLGWPKLKCLFPTCQWGHDEQDRAIAVPFVF